MNRDELTELVERMIAAGPPQNYYEDGYDREMGEAYAEQAQRIISAAHKSARVPNPWVVRMDWRPGESNLVAMRCLPTDPAFSRSGRSVWVMVDFPHYLSEEDGGGALAQRIWVANVIEKLLEESRSILGKG